jgi:hypothetical protein
MNNFTNFDMNHSFVLPSMNLYKYLLKQKEEIEKPLADLGQHAKAISEYMAAIEIESWETLLNGFILLMR